jgi:hypothetical protein
MDTRQRFVNDRVESALRLLRRGQSEIELAKACALRAKDYGLVTQLHAYLLDLRTLIAANGGRSRLISLVKFDGEEKS